MTLLLIATSSARIIRLPTNGGKTNIGGWMEKRSILANPLMKKRGNGEKSGFWDFINPMSF